MLFIFYASIKMLDTLKKHISHQVDRGQGKLVKNWILNLPGHKRQKEIQEIESLFSVSLEEIANIQNELLNILTEDCSWASIRKDFVDTMKVYDNYFDTFKDDKFLIAKEIFSVLTTYFDKVIPQEKEKFISLLLKNPGIDKDIPRYWKLIEFYAAKSKSPTTKKLPDTSDTAPKKKLTQKMKDEQQTTEFISSVEEIILWYRVESMKYRPEDLTSQHKKEKLIKKTNEKIEKQFLSVFAMERTSRKTLYKILWLSDEYSHYIKNVDLEIIDILLHMRLVDKTDPVLLEKYNNDLYLVVEPYLPEDLRKKSTSPQWVKIVWKIELPQEPVYKKHATTTDPLSLVGEGMTKYKFLAKAWLNYIQIQEYIDTKIAVPALYLRTIETKGTKPTKLHFFIIGEETRENNHVSISICVKDEVWMSFKESMVYKLYLTETGQNMDAEENIKKQTQYVRWMTADVFEANNKPSGQQLWEDRALQILKKKNELKGESNNE